MIPCTFFKFLQTSKQITIKVFRIVKTYVNSLNRLIEIINDYVEYEFKI